MNHPSSGLRGMAQSQYRTINAMKTRAVARLNHI